MNLSSSLLDASAVRVESHVADKTGVFTLLASMSADSYGLDAADVLARLEERERLGSTGFGRGIAIPHGKLPGISEPVGLVLRLARPVAFGALDEQPVDLVYGLISPVGGGAMHLKALAEISRLMRDEKILAKLRGARDAGALYALLVERPERDAA